VQHLARTPALVSGTQLVECASPGRVRGFIANAPIYTAPNYAIQGDNMGEAKKRGTLQERAAAAMQQRSAAVAAPRIVCNGCQAELQDIHQVDVGQLRGIDLAFKAHCAACDQETWAVRGETASVRAFYEALEKAAGQKVRLGTSPGLAN